MFKLNKIQKSFKSIKNSNSLYISIKRRYFNSDEFKLDKKNCLDYLNHSFNQFQDINLLLIRFKNKFITKMENNIVKRSIE